MRIILRCLTVLLPLPCLLLSQHWEVGADGGYGAFRDVSVSAGTATGTTGFSSGYTFGALLGSQFNRLAGGEIRYTYQADDLRVSLGSTEVKAKARSQALHYDVLIHATSMDSPVRPVPRRRRRCQVLSGHGGGTRFSTIEQSRGALTHHGGPTARQCGRRGEVQGLQTRAGASRFSGLCYAAPN